MPRGRQWFSGWLLCTRTRENMAIILITSAFSCFSVLIMWTLTPCFGLKFLIGQYFKVIFIRDIFRIRGISRAWRACRCASCYWRLGLVLGLFALTFGSISEELSLESEGSEKFEGDEDLFLAVGDLDWFMCFSFSFHSISEDLRNLKSLKGWRICLMLLETWIDSWAFLSLSVPSLKNLP